MEIEGVVILAVDDDPFMRSILSDILGEVYRVVMLESGGQCLDWLADHHADLVLLDAKMPGMDGYETCQQIKTRGREAPPVIFVSSADTLQDRIRGYDAGGDDYIVKPFDGGELLTKVSSILLATQARRDLSQQANFACHTAMTALTSMGEMGTLLQALKRFNLCHDLHSLARAVTAALAEYGLEGVVRVRTALEECVLSTRGTPTPLEEAAIESVAGMGRIMEFRSRLSIAYDRVVILVSNGPLDDDARRGRLRDHLAVLAEGTEARADAIQRERLVALAVTDGTAALAALDTSQRRTRAATSMAVEHLRAELEKACLSVALTDGQEAHMVDVVSRGVDRILAAVSADFDLQESLTRLVDELRQATA